MAIYGHIWPIYGHIWTIHGPYMGHIWPYMGHIWSYMVVSAKAVPASKMILHSINLLKTDVGCKKSDNIKLYDPLGVEL